MAFQESILSEKELAQKETQLREHLEVREEDWESNRDRDVISDWRDSSDFAEMLAENNGFNWEE